MSIDTVDDLHAAEDCIGSVQATLQVSAEHVHRQVVRIATPSTSARCSGASVPAPRWHRSFARRVRPESTTRTVAGITPTVPTKAKLVGPCPLCGQKANEPPGFYLAAGPEAIIIGTSELDSAALICPDVVRCRSCGAVVTMAPNGSIRVRQPKPDELGS